MAGINARHRFSGAVQRTLISLHPEHTRTGSWGAEAAPREESLLRYFATGGMDASRAPPARSLYELGCPAI